LDKVMPYKVRYQPKRKPKRRPWKIWNLDTNKQVGSSLTKANAKASIRARYMGHRSKGK